MAQPRTIPDYTGTIIGAYQIGSEVKIGHTRAYRCTCLYCGKTINKAASNLKRFPNIQCNCQKIKDLTGQVFGNYTVLDKVTIPAPKGATTFRWRCRCICGKISLLARQHLTSGDATSCGCVNKVDLTGKSFGYLTVQSRLGYIKDKTLYACLCKCGKIINLSHSALSSGNTKSCGCSKSELISLTLGGTGIPYEFTSLNDFIRKHTLEYAEWVKACLKRDNYTCQITGKRGGNLNVHHKKALNTILAENKVTKENYLEFAHLLFDLSNGITLSEETHVAFHTNYGNGGNTEEQLTLFMESYNG